jgi:predicted nucleic-acid-binding protein
MIGLDANVLARYFIEDAGDAAAAKQREAARRLIESGQPLMVCKTVLLELEWVMRGHYTFTPAQVRQVLQHLLAMPHVTVEDRDVVVQALSKYQAGIDLADALHHASHHRCKAMASFDDKRKKLALAPAVVVPA